MKPIHNRREAEGLKWLGFSDSSFLNIHLGRCVEKLDHYNVAAAMGYNAIKVDAGGGEMYYIILNRSAVITDGENYK